MREGGGEIIPTLAGTTAELPFRGEHPCFQNRQAVPCGNQAEWRMETRVLCLHWCGTCKLVAEKKFPEAEWVHLRDRPAHG